MAGREGAEIVAAGRACRLVAWRSRRPSGCSLWRVTGAAASGRHRRRCRGRRPSGHGGCGAGSVVLSAMIPAPERYGDPRRYELQAPGGLPCFRAKLGRTGPVRSSCRARACNLAEICAGRRRTVDDRRDRLPCADQSRAEQHLQHDAARPPSRKGTATATRVTSTRSRRAQPGPSLAPPKGPPRGLRRGGRFDLDRRRSDPLDPTNTVVQTPEGDCIIVREFAASSASESCGAGAKCKTQISEVLTSPCSVDDPCTATVTFDGKTYGKLKNIYKDGVLVPPCTDPVKASLTPALPRR